MATEIFWLLLKQRDLWTENCLICLIGKPDYSIIKGIWVRNYLFACEKLGLTKSKMASVEEIRTRISLREHDVINVSCATFSHLNN